MKCEICGKEFEQLGFASHIRSAHKISSKDYYDRFMKKSNEGICKTCGRESRFISIINGYDSYCSDKCNPTSVQCKLCNEYLKNNIALERHIRFYHTESSQEYYDLFIEPNITHICSCGKPSKFIGLTRGYCDFCTTCEENRILSQQVRCKICNTILDNPNTLPVHIHKTHNITDKEYYDNYIKIDNEDICKTCGNTTKFISLAQGYNKYCSYHCNPDYIDVYDTCKICNIEFPNSRELTKHLKSHNITAKKYYDMYYKKSTDGKCIECGKSTKFIRYPSGYSEYCSDKCAYSGNTRFDKLHKNNLEKYGFEHTSQIPEVKQKRQKTNLEQYGVKEGWNTEKTKQTMLERYGVEYAAQSKTVQQKREKTCLERYGIPNTLHTEQAKQKTHQTMLERYGVDYYVQSKDFLDKAESTMLERYGVKHTAQSPELNAKILQTKLEKYGSRNPFANYSTYKYNDEFFDSSWELAIYIYCLDNNIDIIREPIELSYIDENNNIRHYYPDFLIYDNLIEVKGDQFFNENGELIDLMSKRTVKEKYQCMIDNNIKIMRYEECKPYIDYCIVKFNDKTWYKQFKHSKDVDK